MSRIIAAILVSWITFSALAEDPAFSRVEAYLHQGNFAEGETALLLALDSNPKDDEARFGLGVIQLFRAIENLGQALYEYGAITDSNNMPFLRLPVPKNESPSAISYRALGRILDAFASDLSRAEQTLADIEDKDVKLRLRLSRIQFDFADSGKDRISLIEVLTKLNGGRPFEFQKRNPDFRFHFDRGDVAWLRAYCNLLGAMVNCYRAIDEEAGFEDRVRDIFPRIEATTKNARPDWITGLKVKDAPRFRRARLQLLSVCDLNQETWKHIRNETDDDFEWLSNSTQKEQLGLPVSDQQIDAWLSMMAEFGRLLQGKSLIPEEFLQGAGIVGEKDSHERGLNVQKLLDDPPADLFNLERIRNEGIEGKYMEDLNSKNSVNLVLLFQTFQLFQGPFGFATAVRMN